MPLDFSDVEYWNSRFRTETKPFEWLKNPVTLLPHVEGNLELIPPEDRHILHVGPGSSTLALSLRRLVSDPQRVHNVDYSQSAISLGIDMESKAFTHDAGRSMRWTCADLLNHQVVSSLKNKDLFSSQYSLIVDKSTSDAIACGPDVWLFPQVFRTTDTGSNDEDNGSEKTKGEEKMHPVLLLMLHLAILASTDARWLCLSYSSERFSSLTNPIRDDHQIGSLDPRRYWTLETVVEIPVNSTPNEPQDNVTPIYQPQVVYWLYVLKRTREGLALFTM